MRIGIDIDDTITNTREYVIYLKKKNFPDRDPLKPLPQKVFQRFIEQNDPLIHEFAPLKPGAKKALLWLKQEGHEIVLLTARGKYQKGKGEDHTQEITSKYFEKKGIPIDTLICNLQSKVEAAKKERIDLFIDDNIEICKEVQNAGIPVIKMERYDDVETSLFTLKNWEEIVEYIKENY